MDKRYSQLTVEERIEMYRLHADGTSRRMIAAWLGRSPATISRELRRNSLKTKAWGGGYAPLRAQALAERRRQRGRPHKLTACLELQATVREYLLQGWSPEQIAGRLRRVRGQPVISHESIYRFIYHRSAQKDYWHRLLPRRKSRRGCRSSRGGSSVLHLAHRVPIHDRPASARDRAQPGHWEADLMLFRKYGQAILVLHERSSRHLRLSRQPNKAARPVAESLLRLLQPLPLSLRRSLTFDNGTEFASHYLLTQSLHLPTFFCDAHKPWQKGGIENAIGRMRRHLPRKTDLATLLPEQLDACLQRYNNTPRKCLRFLTPNEAFAYASSSVALQT
ncbi:MAG: IS30 family transposase [Terriglobia bacterium]